MDQLTSRTFNFLYSLIRIYQFDNTTNGVYNLYQQHI